MTLFKQIALVVTMGVLVLLTLISLDNFRQTSDFVEGQIQTSAQDVATTLGIAISTTNSGDDVAALETFFNAMFDSGYYSQIRLVHADGSVIHSKSRDLSIENIPDWFIDLVPLSASTGRAEVRQGWVKMGTLEVTAHPALAYAQLFDNLKSSLVWFLGIFLAILAVLWFDLHMLLKPLQRVKDQAQAINDNQFIKQDTIPKTTELRSVVEAMNHMTDKVQHIFNDQEQALSKYQTLIYTDESTGLANRKFMMSYLSDLVAEESSFSGTLLVLKVLQLKKLKENVGYQAEQLFVTKLAGVMAEVAGLVSDVKLARLGEDEFAIVGSFDQLAAERLAGEVFEGIVAEIKQESQRVPVVGASVDVHGGQKLGSILSDVDMALTQAYTSGGFKYRHAASTHLVLPEGKIQWRQWFKDKLSQDAFYLVGQPVFNQSGDVVQRELYIRIDDNKGSVIPAGIFMPMAQVLDFDLEIDRKVFSLLQSASKAAIAEKAFSLNLSRSFFQRAEAFGDFIHLLDHYRSQDMSLDIEASHHVVLQYPEMCAQIAESVRERGHRFGIDHLDLNRTMQALHSVRPGYVKVSGQMLWDLSQKNDSGAYQALRTLTSALDIEIIAVGIDNDDVATAVKELRVDGVQGNYFGKSEVLF